MQDELAETQCASPGYAGTNNELAMETYEYDIYEYYGELEYGSDSYWDANMRHLEGAKKTDQTGSKRKRDDGQSNEKRSSKKRKVPHGHPESGLGDTQIENVVYMPFEARLPPSPPKPEKKKSFALLPDWKQRFSSKEEAKPPEKAMPADMRRAAEGKDEELETPPKPSSKLVGQTVVTREAEEDWEDEDEGGSIGGLDPAMLQAVLKQKLQESGLGDMDEGMFSQAIASMLSGSGGDAAGDLANMLLGKANEAGESALTGWLSQQGVRMDEDGDENDSTANEDVQNEADTSPPDSAVGISVQQQNGRGSGKASNKTRSDIAGSSEANETAVMHNSFAGSAAQPSTGVQSRKRKANTGPSAKTDEEQPAKRRQPSHAASPPPEQQSGPAASAGRRTRAALGARGRK